MVYVVLCLIVFGCQYQCNWLPGKTRLWNDLPYYVSSGMLNPTHTHSPHVYLPVNNVLCYFPTLTADVRYKLFRSYCSSIFGYELWQFDDVNVNTFFTAWWRGFRRVWIVTNTTHCDIVHIFCDEIPIFDEICHRSLMFIHKYSFHISNTVKFITTYGIMTGRQNSTLDSNFYLCISCFNVNQWALYNGCVNISDINHKTSLRYTETRSAVFYSAISVWFSNSVW